MIAATGQPRRLWATLFPHFFNLGSLGYEEVRQKAIETADEDKLKQEASTIAHIGAHNAYYIGQIIYVRKEQRSCDPAKGVK